MSHQQHIMHFRSQIHACGSPLPTTHHRDQGSECHEGHNYLISEIILAQKESKNARCSFRITK